jgi:hypothetical protein
MRRPFTFIYLPVLLLLCHTSVAQQQDTLIEWDPRGTSVSLQLQPYYLEYNNANPLNFGFGGRLDIYLPKVISLHASAKQALFDLNNYNGNTKGFKNSENPTNLFRQGEAGIGIYLNFDGYATARVYAWPGTAYIDPTEKDTLYEYTKEMLPARIMVGLRGGYYGWKQSVDKAWLQHKLEGTNSLTGAPYTFADTLDIFTNMSCNGLYAGISISKLVDVFYRSEIGQRNVSFIRNLFLDVLYCPTIKTDQVIYLGVPYDVSGSKGFKSQKIGGRIVAEKVGTWDAPRLNFSYRFEAGIRPGLAGKGFYIMQTIGMGFAR